MATATVKASATTFVNQAAPNSQYAGSTRLYAAESASAATRSFIFAAPSVSHLATITNATLTVYVVGGQTWAGESVSLTQVTSRVPDTAKTWNHQPSIGTVGGGAAAAVTMPSGVVADAYPVTFDVTSMVNQWITTGVANYGWELRNAGTTRRSFYSHNSAHPPVLTIHHTQPPDTPHGLVPAGVTGLTRPVLNFGPYGDVDGDNLQSIRVQIGTTSAFSTIVYDSELIAGTVPELNLATQVGWLTQLSSALSTSAAITSLPVQALGGPLASGTQVTIGYNGNTQTWTLTAAAAAGATSLTVASQTPNYAYPAGTWVTGLFGGFTSTAQYWRAQVQDSSGATSAWSDPVSVTYTAHASVALSSPSSADPHVYEATPQIVWSTTVQPQSSWKVDILNAQGATIASSGHQAGTTNQWGVPAGVIQPNNTYTAVVYVWDVTRSASPGDPTWTKASQTFAFIPKGSTPAPTAVTAAQGSDWPGQVKLTWTAASAPDYFTIYMDGQVVASQIHPGDALISGTTYGWSMDTTPRGTHSWTVDSVTTGNASNPSAAVQFNNQINGIWLGDPLRKLWAVIHSGVDTSVDSLSMKDQVTVTQPIDGTIPQQIIRAMNGLSGHLSGFLSNKLGISDVSVYAGNLMQLKGAPQATLRLVMGDYNIPVKVSNLSVGPSTNDSNGNPWRNVSFDFFQCGEFPFQAAL